MHNFAQVCAVMNVWRATSNFEAYIKTFNKQKSNKMADMKSFFAQQGQIAAE